MENYQQAVQYPQDSRKPSKTKNPSNFDWVFQTIAFDSMYRDKNMPGALICTKEVGSFDAIQKIRQSEILFEKIKKNKPNQTYHLEKTLDTMKVITASKLAPYFYPLILSNAELPIFSNFEPSPAMTQFLSLGQELRMQDACWSGDPLSVISPSGLLEGELFNSFIQRLQEAFASKGFRAKVAARKSQSRAEFTRAKRYFERLQANYQNLFTQRLELNYSPSHAANVTIEESNRHVLLFTDALKKSPELGFPVGWWRKREFLTETSYRYKFIIFFDASATPNFVNCAQVLGDHWQTVSKNTGTWESVFDPSNPNTWGQGFGAQYPDQFEALLASVRFMCDRDNYLRLAPNSRFPHVGMGEFPKLTLVNPRIIPTPQPQHQQCQR